MTTATHPTTPPPGADLGAIGRAPGRAPWVALADGLLDAAWRHASPSGALLRLPGPQSASGAWSDGLEGYARTFLAAAFRIAGADGDDPAGLLGRYAAGLAAGVDPAHPERWPRFDERRQAVVEAASIAIGLSETRPWLWDRLDARTQARTVAWLSRILGMTGFRNNWLWFQNVIEAFLGSVGAAESREDLDRNAELAESLYVGDGWYSDGRGRDGERQSFDWYAGWAWHVYPLLESRIRGLPLADRHRERLAQYLGQARELIGSDGSPVLFGRSLAYRFAAIAPFWAGAIAGVTPLAPGETRTVGARMVDGFLRGGAVGDDGLLSIGWHGAFPRVRQLYTGGASPYWASKGLLGLLLPADHAEWTAEPPASRAEVRTTALAVPGWLVTSTPDGIVRLVNHGSDRMLEPRIAPRADDPFYRRTGYSNVTSPQLGPSAVASPRESHTTLLDAHGLAAHRDAIERVAIAGRVAVSRSRVHWLDVPGGARSIDDGGWAGMRRGPVLTTASVQHGALELRLAWWHRHEPATGRAASAGELDGDAAWPVDEGPWRISFGGWPLAAAERDDLRSEVSADAATVTRADGVVSHIQGQTPAMVAEIIDRDGADPHGRWSAAPVAVSVDALEEGRLAAAVVVLSRDGVEPEEPWLTIHDERIVVRWADGTSDSVPTQGSVAW
ncbi:DUF2264 domain-containing protein [Microbacterium gilvum]|uniref:DUF2264 domain-containing protein n=1 Tax=Microbacterium gilvum TaxID=1336204 RepID=UPI0031EE475D